MKITPLAADSMGTRSMATFVETARRKILIDPGADVGLSRYGLPPHELENFQLTRHLERIRLYAESAQIIIITQFVREHLDTDAAETYRDKVLFMKNPNQDIPSDQRARAFALIRQVQGLAREIIYADGRTFETGGVTLTFSTPCLRQDADSSVYSLPLIIQEGDTTFFYSSECLGILDEPFKRLVIKHNPSIIYLDGPASYLQQPDSSVDIWKQFQTDLTDLLEVTTARQLILDHHFTRDIHWEKRRKALQNITAARNISVKTAAEFRGEQNDMLEARRRQLFEEGSSRLAFAES